MFSINDKSNPPPKDEFVLTYRPDEDGRNPDTCFVIAALEDRWDTGYDWYDSILGVPIKYITHWMPFPSRPEVQR